MNGLSVPWAAENPGGRGGKPGGGGTTLRGPAEDEGGVEREGDDGPRPTACPPLPSLPSLPSLPLSLRS